MIFTLLFLLACPHVGRAGGQAADLPRTSDQADPAGGQRFVYPATCAPPNVTQLLPSLQGQMTLPPIPQLPSTYQVRVEGNMLNKNYTISAVEFYDSYTDRAAIRSLKNDTKAYAIFDYKNDQVLYYFDKDGTCYADDLKYDANSLMFGLRQHGGSSHPLTATASLHMAASNGLTYMGKSTVRGIPADHWQSCMYWPTVVSNFTLDWYFSEYDWKTPDLTHQVPLRAETVGMMCIPYGHCTNLHHIYDYYDFRMDDWDENTVFQTPEGAVCIGRKDTKPLPSVPNSFSLREEIVDSGNQAVSQADEWYDYNYQVERLDYRNYAPPYIISDIHDFTTGITYRIDRKLKNCSIMAITNTTHGAHVNISTTPSGRQEYYLNMKNGSQVFYLDDKYVYTGQRTVRGILCDVFISRRTDFHLPGYDSVNSTFEMYFLQSSWVSQSNTGLTTPTAIPIQLKITTPAWVGFDASYNFYNFDNENPPLETYDITSCYNTSTMRPVRITFPTGGYDNNQLVAHKADLLASAIQAVTIQSRMSTLRVQKPEIYIDQYNIYFVATLLDVPPAKAFYQKHLGYSMTGTRGRQLTRVSEEACASACNSVTDPCDAFDFCATTGVCTLYMYTTRAAGDLVPSNTCDHHTRTVKAFEDMPTLEKVLKDLDEAVSSTKLYLTLPTTTDGSQLKTFKATRLNIVDNEGKPAGYYPVIG